MSSYTLTEDRLEKALEKLWEELAKKGAIAGNHEDKQKAIETVKKALINSYPDGVPQDLFTDSAKQKTLMVGLISVPLMDKNPALRFDLDLFFKAKLEPAEAKKVFKACLTALNQCKPSNQRRSEKEIEAEAKALAEEMEQERKEKEIEDLSLVDSHSASKALDEIFETLYGMTPFGMPIALMVNKGNVGGVIDTYSARNAGGGSIHEGRGLAGDYTTDPYVNAMAKERLLNLAGIGAEVLKDLQASHIIHQTPTYKPPGAL